MLWCQASVEDVASIATSAVTIALVVVTYFSVRAARNAARAAEASAKLAERQLQEAHRPLLIPDRPRPDGHEIDMPCAQHRDGPVLRVFCRAQFLNQPPAVVGRFPARVLPAVAAGGEVATRLGLDADDLVSVRITYVNAADQAYTSESHWDRRLRRFTRTTVNDGDEVRVAARVAITPRAGTDPDPDLQQPR